MRTYVFPEWVESTRSKKNKASRRLRYLITTLALEVTGAGTISAFARHIDRNKSTLLKAINAGSCPASLAVTIERAVGRETINYEMLMDPMTIEQG